MSAPKKHTQEARIEKYLLEPGASLTPIEALELFGCFRLASVIHRLKERHDEIATEMVHENGKAFARYRITKAGRQKALDLPRSPDDFAEERSEDEARERLGMQS